MNRRYQRKVSRIERFWIVSNQMINPFANQAILEGEGEFDIKKWKNAVKEASKANPGSRLILKGGLKFSKWVDSGITPRVREVDGSNWTGMGPENASFLHEHLSARKGPTCDVILINGNPPRVAFRSHHAVMDGRGTMVWMEDIFRVLIGEPPLGSDFTLNEMQFVRMFQKEEYDIPPDNNIAPTGISKGVEQGVTWCRRQIQGNGKYHHLLGQVAVLIAREAQKHSDGNVRLVIPIDMRHRQSGIRATGNLSNGIFIEVKKNTTAEMCAEEISKQIADMRDVMLGKGTGIVDFIPICILSFLVQKNIEQHHKKGLYRCSGVLSNLGKLPLEKYNGGGFHAKTGFFIPPGNEAVPFFMSLAGGENTLELVITMPRSLASEGRLNEIIENIASGLKTSP